MSKAVSCLVKHMGASSPARHYRADMKDDVDDLVSRGVPADEAWAQVTESKLLDLRAEQERIEQSVADAYAKTPAGKPASVAVAPPADVAPAKAAPAEQAGDLKAQRDDGFARWAGRVAKRQAMENAGQDILDDMEEAETSPQATAKAFWSNTYFLLPAPVQDRFRRMLAGHVGGERGGDLDAQIEDIDLGNRVEHLEGTDRGFVALMQDAIRRVATRDETSSSPSALRSGAAGFDVLDHSQTQRVTAAEMLRQPGFAAGAKRLADLGLGHLAGWVGEWRSAGAAGDNVAAGWIESRAARFVLTLKNALNMANESEAAWVYTHELFHAADLAPLGGVYSSHPDLAFTDGAGGLEASGAVAREMEALYKGSGPLGGVLSYPFDYDAMGVSRPDVAAGELFAELGAMMAHPQGRLELEFHAPLTFQFMTEAINDIKAKPATQVRVPGEVQVRRAGFQKRHPGAQPRQWALAALRPGQVGGSLPGQPGGSERGPLRHAGNAASKLDALPERPRFDAVLAKLPPSLRPGARILHEVLASAGRKALNTIAFTEDLFKIARQRGIAATAEYQRLFNERRAFVGEYERNVLDVVSEYHKLPEADKGKGPDSANEFIKRSTMGKAWGYQPKWMDKPVTVDPAMAAAYAKLSDKSQAFVDSLFHAGSRALAAKKKAVIDSVNSEYDALIAAAAGDEKKLAELTAEKTKMLDSSFGSLLSLDSRAPYAPLKRFGKYVVMAESPEYRAAKKAEDQKLLRKLEQDEAHYFVDFVDSKGEGERMLDKLRAAGFKEPVYRERELARDDLYGGSKTLHAIGKLRARVDMKAEDGAERDALRKALTDLYLMQLAEDSARKSEVRRRNIAGDIDMVRSFESQGQADARFMGAVKYGQPMLETLNAMRVEVREGTKSQTLAKSEVFNEIVARHLQAMDWTPTPWADAVVRGTSLWFLSTSPSYYLQNLTQPWMMSLPVMAARHGYGESSSALVQAYRDISVGLQDFKVFEQFDFGRLAGEGSALKADEVTLLREMLNSGRIDVGLLTELGAARVDPEGTATKAWGAVDRKLRGVQLRVEAVNRLSTALAAYRLERAKNPGAKAVEYADSVVQDTHGDYAAGNAPRAFNTALGKVALQFRKFQLIQLTMMAKLLHRSFAGASAEEKTVARKALAYTLGQAAVMGGGKALPIPFLAAWLFAKAFGDDADEPPEYVLRKMIGNKDIADLLVNGLPAKLTGFNAGALGSMGNMLSITPFTDLPTDSKTMAPYLVALMGGPFSNLTMRAADGMARIADGDVLRGSEGLLPKGIASFLKAHRTHTEGATQRDGDVTMSPDEVTYWDTIQQAVGFTPQRQQDRFYRQGAAHDITTALKDQSARIKSDYTKALRGGDPDARQDAREAWEEYQTRRVSLGFKRQPMTDLLKAPQEQTKRERSTVGNVQYRKSEAAFARDLAAN